MIEINLLPGTTRRSGRRLPRLSLGGFKRSADDGGGGGGLPRAGVDRWSMLVVICWLFGCGLVGWLFVDARSTKAELEVAIEGARLDSIRYAEMRRINEVLLARQDTIEQKLQIIQKLDSHRYTWAHIVDEVSRAVPQYTWLVNIMTNSLTDEMEDGPTFSINGRTGTPFALTELMQRLEASPFVHNVTLVQTDQIREDGKLMYSFVLEMQYQKPTPDLIETIPLFSRGDD